jgi:hypothetical protein
VIDKLVEPELHGGSPKDAFYLSIPALPGYAFSSNPTERGWDYRRTARAWAELMQRLGGDWGAYVVASVGHQAPKGLKNFHMNSIFRELKVKIPALTYLGKTYANLRYRKRLRYHAKTRKAKNEPCV